MTTVSKEAFVKMEAEAEAADKASKELAKVAVEGMLVAVGVAAGTLGQVHSGLLEEAEEIEHRVGMVARIAEAWGHFGGIAVAWVEGSSSGQMVGCRDCTSAEGIAGSGCTACFPASRS